MTSAWRLRARELRSPQGALLAATVLLCAAPVTMATGVVHDDSWKVVLWLVRGQHLQYGKSIDFTYGPWGFLDWPLAVDRFYLALTIVFWIGSLMAGWYTLRSVSSRALPRVSAAVLATVIIVVTTPSVGAGSISATLLLAAALLALDHVGLPQERMRTWAPAAIAAVAAFLLQVKFSEGVSLTAVAVVACALAPKRRLRGAAEALGAYVAVTVVAWVSAGQSLSHFWSWLRVSVAISRYYVDAQALAGRPNQFTYLLIVLIVVTVFVYSVKFWRKTDARRGAGVLGVAALIEYLAFRESTDVYEPTHIVMFFVWTIPVVLWFVPEVRIRTFRWTVLALVAVMGWNNLQFLQPRVVAARWDQAAEVLVHPDYQQSLLARSRASNAAVYQVPTAMITAIGRHPVAVDGSATQLPWVYQLTMRVPPLVQGYQADGPLLDRLDTEWFRRLPADTFILRPARNGKNTLWAPPRYVVNEMCSTRVVLTDARWMLLRKTADHCTAARAAGTVVVRAGQRVPIPRPGAGQLVTASFRPRPQSLPTRVISLLDKPPAPLWMYVGDKVKHLPRGLVAGPLAVGMPHSLDWPDKWGGGTWYGTIGFSEPGTIRFAVRDLTGVTRPPAATPDAGR